MREGKVRPATTRKKIKAQKISKSFGAAPLLEAQCKGPVLSRRGVLKAPPYQYGDDEEVEIIQSPGVWNSGA